MSGGAGAIADWTNIEFVYRMVSFLPIVGLLTAFLPTNVANRTEAKRRSSEKMAGG